jgi:CBS domain-containing protein
LVGILFSRQIIKRLAPPFISSKIEDIYHKNLITVSPDIDLSEITTLMAEKDIHTLPVLDGDKLIGIIGKCNIIREMA